MSKPKFLIFSDCDGVLTPPLKTLECTFVRDTYEHRDQRWAKDYSDRDSWVIERLRDVFVVISTDARNEHWAKHKGLTFVCPGEPDKVEMLRAHWRERVESGDVEGDPDKPVYIYLGDSPQEWECLTSSVLGFIPSDASQLLQRKAANVRKVRLLESRGGEGCVEEAIMSIYDTLSDMNPKDARFEHPIWDEIERYLS